ncbi:Renin receptor [Geodia barretti]|uniref:Renin receptor n=2 Tax=Geodia barretti TaxID=519541 RepID=A0AA35RIV8_GEOBA|nr:Renin receptor [Geodia barretti]
MAAHRIVLPLLVLGILGCWSLTGETSWEIHLMAKSSSSSGFYILNDYQDTFAEDSGSTSAFPATAVSNIMLKTLGILRDGARWAGVQMGSLFSRPHATALFVVDGVSSGAIASLSEKKFTVDQSGLTGSTSLDMQTMFSGDNVATHMSKIFDGRCQTRSISADQQAALAGSAEGSFSGGDQFTDTVKMIRGDSSVLVPYGLETKGLDVGTDEDVALLAELFMIHQTMEQLKELKNYANDGAPDIYIFTISTIRALELKYGVGSEKVLVATKLVQSTIQKVTKDLVGLYDGKILVQALVLEWNFPEGPSSESLAEAHDLLKPHLASPSFEDFKSDLPQVNLKPDAIESPYLCFNLKKALGPSFKVKCPETNYWTESRYVRDADNNVDDGYEDGYRDDVTANITLGNVDGGRSEGFAAIFLITLFLGLSLGLAVYAG